MVPSRWWYYKKEAIKVGIEQWIDTPQQIECINSFLFTKLFKQLSTKSTESSEIQSIDHFLLEDF